MSQEDRQFVEAFARGMQLFEALSKHKKSMTNGDLARATGLPPSTISRLSYTAMKLGYLSHSGNGRAYQLTPKTLNLGYSVLSGMALIDRCTPLLKTLSEKTGQTVGLCVRDKLHVSFVQVEVGADLFALRFAVGGRLPVATSAAGIATLCILSERERRTMSNRVRSELNRHNGNVDAFNAQLEQCIADGGIAYARNSWKRGVGAVAMGISYNDEQAAITIPFATGSVSEANMRTVLAPILKEAVKELLAE
ncbi:MAG: IclR family transcriptional regulator [Devosia sp.]|nr:IclR family transcriptional regulator [Devosia sp.]